MTSRETRWLGVGILMGALVVAVVGGLFIRSQRFPVEDHAAPASSGSQDGNLESATQLSAEEQSRIGIQTSEVRRESITEEITALGRVVEPESAIGTISTRYGGRVERLFVSYAGQPVKQGDPIAVITLTGQPVGKEDPVSSIYNRDLIAAAEEYKFALENKQRALSASRPDAVAQADALVEASRVRLERFGIAPDQIDRLPARPEQPIQVTINATASGIVRSRKVTEGQFINAGDALIELTDLSTVWVKADVFDTDLPKMRPGLRATIRSEAVPGTLTGVIDFIEPQSDPQTRTTPVRLLVNNPGTRLKPGMVVQSSFDLAPGDTLTVPRAAVIDTGLEKVVYVAADDGVFQKRRIEVGAPSGDRYPVLQGLNAGDKVVTNGVFLLDSQTRLTGGMTGLFGGSKSYGYKMTFRIDPNPPRGAEQNTIHVTLVDAAGKPVPDAQVRASFQMPAMPAMNMPEMRNGAELKWTGSDYAGPIQIMMGGGWNVVVEARRGNELLATMKTQINAR
jgi:RND family efflux transporter MFP subunit